MNIIHVNLAMGYTEGMNYQENCISKCHAMAGHNVTLIASPYCFNNGVWGLCTTSFDYINEHGVHVIRLPFLFKLPYRINKQIGCFRGTYETIKNICPDIIFVHNIQFQDLRSIVKYKKRHPEVKLFIDNHVDFSNGARTWLSKNVLYRFWWKPCAKAAEPYTDKFFGVMPSRVDFLTDVYGIPKQKCELLVMGGDDEAIEHAKLPAVREAIRSKYGICENDFLIMTGGKIDKFKTQTLLLLQAIQKMKNCQIKLIIFGSIDQVLESQILKLCDGKKIQYIGWAEGNQSYDYFGAADLVVFPGRHSVYWEQVVSLGIPMICKYWEGTTHIDLGGNVIFLKKDSIDEIYNVIYRVYHNKQLFEKMKKVAQEKGKPFFSYQKISQKAIGL
ncbi:MAG: glycosyltransferase family 4 protein [Eubacterium sp.]|nr:glycosyltransferase family 4 protein [Eubacterium sp.]